VLDSRHQRKDKRPQPKILSSLDYDRDKMSVMKETRLTLNNFEFRDNATITSSKPETRNSQLKPNKEKVSSNAM